MEHSIGMKLRKGPDGNSWRNSSVTPKVEIIFHLSSSATFLTPSPYSPIRNFVQIIRLVGTQLYKCKKVESVQIDMP